jgi:hypothetical protein
VQKPSYQNPRFKTQGINKFYPQLSHFLANFSGKSTLNGHGSVCGWKMNDQNNRGHVCRNTTAPAIRLFERRGLKQASSRRGLLVQF